MKPLVLTLRGRPDQRLDLSVLVPQRLAGLTEADIEKIELQTTRQRVVVGDAFRLRMGDAKHIRIEASCDRLDRIGEEMIGGEIVVEGDAGARAGRLMKGGRLTVRGSAGPLAASGMKGGAIEIAGDAGDRLGGPLAGEVAGMRGGIVRSGSKVGSKYKGVIASTNDAFTPTLRGATATALDPDVACVLEIVIDGLTSDAVADAMRAGIAAIIKLGPRRGAVRISAGNYGGKLGPHHYHLQELMP